MHPLPKLPRALAVDDPDLQDAPLPALLQVFRHQVAHLGRLEQVQIERAVYGSLGWFGGWNGFFVGHGNWAYPTWFGFLLLRRR